jgi:hypothetical protein
MGVRIWFVLGGVLLGVIVVASIADGTWPKVSVLAAAAVLGVWLGRRRHRPPG